MYSKNQEQLQSDLRARSAAVKRDIQCACDAAFLRLRDKERHLLRVVDLVTWRQQGDLWAAGLLQQQQQQQQSGSEVCPPGTAPPAPQPTLSLSLDCELLHSAIQQFATVQIGGLVTSPTGVTSSSLPDGPEEYGAEEHLVSHKPLPGSPGSVLVTRPPSLTGYGQAGTHSGQFGPSGGHSWASSLTSSDDDEKFELIADDLTPVTVFRCDPVNSDEEESACPARPAADLSQWLAPYPRPPTSADARRGQGQTGRPGGLRLDPVVPHPLSDSHRAWLLRPGTAGGESSVPSPMAQWQAAMASDALFRPGSATPSTDASAASVTSENRGWLLRPADGGVGQALSPADGLSQCTERAARLSLEENRAPWLAQAARLSLEETRSPWLAQAARLSLEENRSSWLLGSGARGPGGPFPAMEEEEDVMEPGAVPDLLAPFKQMESTTAWVAARG